MRMKQKRFATTNNTPFGIDNVTISQRIKLTKSKRLISMITVLQRNDGEQKTKSAEEIMSGGVCACVPSRVQRSGSENLKSGTNQ